MGMVGSIGINWDIFTKVVANVDNVVKHSG